jgi:hypothetical protein
VEFDDMPIRTMENGIDTQHRLNVVVTGGQFVQMLEGIAICRIIYDCWFVWRKAVHIDSKEWRAALVVSGLETRLGVLGIGDYYEHSAINRSVSDTRWERYLEPQSGSLRCVRAAGCRSGAPEDQKDD